MLLKQKTYVHTYCFIKRSLYTTKLNDKQDKAELDNAASRVRNLLKRGVQVYKACVQYQLIQ